MKLIGSALYIFLFLGLTLNGCQPISPTAISTSAPSPTPITVCTPSNKTTDEASGYPEIQATATKGNLWALLFTRNGNFQAGTRVRIVWKMTDGRGDIKLTTIHADGTQTLPVWGPISRDIRTKWKHPGQEWGTEYIFPKAGCWRILVSRWLLATDEAVTAEIAIEVK